MSSRQGSNRDVDPDGTDLVWIFDSSAYFEIEGADLVSELFGNLKRVPFQVEGLIALFPNRGDRDEERAKRETVNGFRSQVAQQKRSAQMIEGNFPMKK